MKGVSDTHQSNYMSHALRHGLKYIKQKCVDSFPPSSLNPAIMMLSFEDDDESYSHMLTIQGYLKESYSGSKIDDITVMRLNYNVDMVTCTPGWNIFA